MVSFGICPQKAKAVPIDKTLSSAKTNRQKALFKVNSSISAKNSMSTAM